MKDRYRIAVAHINKGTYSETFIRDHIELLPADVAELYGGVFPIYHRGEPDQHIYSAWDIRLDSYLSSYKGTTVRYFRNRSYARFLRAERIDAVLAEYGLCGAELMPACRLANVPLVVHLHGFDIWKRHIVADMLPRYREMFRFASRIIVGSLDMQEHVEGLGCPPEKLLYNPCGVDISAHRVADVEQSEPLFVAVGRFVPKKAPHLTILAFHQMLRQVPNAKLAFVGDGGELFDFCRQLVDGLGIQSSVELMGVKTREEVGQILSTARAFVQHSMQAPDGDSEGTAISVLEAAATGLPVLATYHAGIKHSVVHEKTGYHVEEGDVSAMAKHMVTLAQDPKLAAALGRAGRQHIEDNYTMTRYIGGLYGALEQAIRDS